MTELCLQLQQLSMETFLFSANDCSVNRKSNITTVKTASGTVEQDFFFLVSRFVLIRMKNSSEISHNECRKNGLKN